uniref:Zinc finger protein 469 n=1 Tax=Anthurium amnicola TaxID=1678845 RepID=A0A1D1XM17_9ARAE
MDSNGLKDRDIVIDLEKGWTTVEDSVSDVKHVLNKTCNGFSSAQQPIRGEEADSLGNVFAAPFDILPDNVESPPEKKLGEEENLGFVEIKTETEPPKKKKACKKPPRPPRTSSLDAAEQKLIQEISDLAMLKRARMERMKALMKTKNTKATSSNSSLCALVIIVLFCLVIIWQGFCSRSHSKVSFGGSPEPSVGTSGQLISVQYFRNVFPSNPNSSTAASVKPSQLGR